MDNASVSDRDIYMRAKLLIDEHGKDKAKAYAAGRVAHLLEQSKMDEAMLWGRIQTAVEKMSAPPIKDSSIL
jgi:hypothetical protein